MHTFRNPTLAFIAFATQAVVSGQPPVPAPRPGPSREEKHMLEKLPELARGQSGVEPYGGFISYNPPPDGLRRTGVTDD